MKKLILLSLALIGGVFTVMAQDDAPAEKVVDAQSRDRLVIDLTHDNWVHHENYLETRLLSHGISLYFMYDILLGNSGFSVAPGAGISYSNVYLNRQFADGADTIVLAPQSEDYKINKFQTVHIDVPLELRYRTKSNHRNQSFKVAVGVKGGLLIDSQQKFSFDDANGDRKIVKYKRWEDLSNVRLGPTFRIGYGAFNLVGFYSLTPLIQDGKGAEINQFSLGISINGL